MGHKEKNSHKAKTATFNAEKTNNGCDVKHITQNDDEKVERYYNGHFTGGYRERGVRANEILGFSNCCNAYSSYIEPMFNIHIKTFVKGLKDISINELDIQEFYEFAYMNSSGIISPYL